MAKGRRLTTSRSERFLGSYSYDHNQGDTVAGESELREEDVWSMVDNGTDRDEHSESSEIGNFETRGNRRRIPRGSGGDRHVGGLSLAFDDSSSTKRGIVHPYRAGHDTAVDEVEAPRVRQLATSAPLNVPDWSKIYRADSVESMQDSDDGDESDRMPPHEYLAREYARNKKSGGASVCEGVGRTLKGRDMRRVRDAVWSQTGFYG